MKRSSSPALPVAACLLVQLCAGIIYLWSVFRASAAATLALTSQAAGMISSYMLFGFVVGCLVGGMLNDKKGPRLTITIGIILLSAGIGSSGLLTPGTAWLLNFTYAGCGGVGSGFAYTACISCVQKWLPERRGFATGLAAAAFGFSTVIFAPFSRVLLNLFTDAAIGLVNFTAVFGILAGIFLVVGLLAACFVSLPAADSPQARAVQGKGAVAPYYDEDLSFAQVLKTVPFWAIFFISFFGVVGWTLLNPQITELGMERGLTLNEATLAISLAGIFNASGRLILASLSDKIGRQNTVILFSCITVLSTILMRFVGGYGYMIVVFLLAFTYGGVGPMVSTMGVDFFGSKNSARNFGLITMSLGFSAVLCNLIANYVLRGAVGPTFTMATLLCCIPILMVAVLRRYQKD